MRLVDRLDSTQLHSQYNARHGKKWRTDLRFDLKLVPAKTVCIMKKKKSSSRKSRDLKIICPSAISDSLTHTHTHMNEIVDSGIDFPTTRAEKESFSPRKGINKTPSVEMNHLGGQT